MPPKAVRSKGRPIAAAANRLDRNLQCRRLEQRGRHHHAVLWPLHNGSLWSGIRAARRPRATRAWSPHSWGWSGCRTISGVRTLQRPRHSIQAKRARLSLYRCLSIRAMPTFGTHKEHMTSHLRRTWHCKIVSVRPPACCAVQPGWRGRADRSLLLDSIRRSGDGPDRGHHPHGAPP